MDHQFGKPLLYTSQLFNVCVILKGRIKKLATKMVITSGNEEDKGSQEKESKEETILAMLGIIGTILNLIVIIFVYIYTTL
ncbi:protein TUNAR isoform X1 [Athene noctua]|uniref:protein TUNAR isoform X1 n=1 Tax=Athene noctua TaxID=126797 RepID=UPI003EBF2A26